MRKIIHVDMDAFFASVEQRDQPEYRGKPVVVGGRADQRGVVAAASYEARAYGIHSAMPAALAEKKCPHAIFLKPRFDVYSQVSEQIREIFRRFTDLVEPLSLDEAYLDVTTNKKENPSATLVAREIKSLILEETELTASAGVSINKFLAKTASGINKPDGLFLIPPERAESFVETLPIEDFYGIGAVTAEKMRLLGIYNGADLKRYSEADLLAKFGKVGSYYYQIARAQDDRPVCPDRIRKSVGVEDSFARDLSGREEILQHLASIAGKLAERLKKAETGGRTLTLKLKYSDYQQITRSRTVNVMLREQKECFDLALQLLENTEAFDRPLRLLGISLSNLEDEGESTADDFVQLKLDLSC